MKLTQTILPDNHDLILQTAYDITVGMKRANIQSGELQTNAVMQSEYIIMWEDITMQ